MADLFGDQTMRHQSLSLMVNGEPAEVSFAPYKTLLELLREDLAVALDGGVEHHQPVENPCSEKGNREVTMDAY